MVLYKNGIALSPEEEARQTQEKQDTGTFQMGVSDVAPTIVSTPNIDLNLKQEEPNVIKPVKVETPTGTIGATN